MTGCQGSCSGKNSSNPGIHFLAAGRGSQVYSLSVKVLPVVGLPILGVRGASLRSEWGGEGEVSLATGIAQSFRRDMRHGRSDGGTLSTCRFEW